MIPVRPQSSNNPTVISFQDVGHKFNRTVRQEKSVPGKIASVNLKPSFVNPYKSLVTEITSGWIGGMLGIGATHPLDCIRVMKQYQARISKNNKSYYSIFTQIRDTHGFAGFYRGIIPPTVLRGLGLAVNRGGYNTAMRFFEGENVKGTWRIWAVGGFAGICTGIVDMPIHLLKCRVQVKAGLTKESFSLYATMLRRIWIYEGFRAFTNGLIPQLLCSGLSYALFYAIYDNMLSYGFPALVSGMVAGTLSWPPVMPLDSLRIRMQCQPYNVSLTTVARDMWRQPVRLWFIGLGATTLRATPRWGITMVAIENCNNILKESF